MKTPKPVKVAVECDQVDEATIRLLTFLADREVPEPVAYVALVRIMAGIMLGHLPDDSVMDSILFQLWPIWQRLVDEQVVQ